MDITEITLISVSDAYLRCPLLPIRSLRAIGLTFNCRKAITKSEIVMDRDEQE